LRQRGRTRKEQQLDFICSLDEMAAKKPSVTAAEHFYRKPYAMLKRKGDTNDKEEK